MLCNGERYDRGNYQARNGFEMHDFVTQNKRHHSIGGLCPYITGSAQHVVGNHLGSVW